MAWHTPRTWNVGELVTKTMLDEQIRDNMNYLLSAAYPVGSQYVNFTDSTNPATLLGFGTWVAVAGRVIVGFDATQTEFDTAGETGGEKTHTLITAEIPSHTHMIYDYHNPSGRCANGTGDYFSKWDDTLTTITGAQGGGGAHQNLQPYIVAYVWKRTA